MTTTKKHPFAGHKNCTSTFAGTKWWWHHFFCKKFKPKCLLYNRISNPNGVESFSMGVRHKKITDFNGKHVIPRHFFDVSLKLTIQSADNLLFSAKCTLNMNGLLVNVRWTLIRLVIN